MLKLLILGLIIYGYYKFFLAPKRIGTRKQQEIEREKKSRDEEYTDYEEVE
jgi:hypothetical protein